MKPLNVLIICGTIIIGLVIWRSAKQSHIMMIPNASGQMQPVQVDVAAIQAVLKQDKDYSSAIKALGENSPTSDDDLDHVAAMINNYVAQAQNIPTIDCPSDFAEAYRRHLGAWSNYAIAISGHPHVEGDGESFVKNFLRGMDFDLQGPERDQAVWQDWKNQLVQTFTSISMTWTDVEALAARYGAQ